MLENNEWVRANPYFTRGAAALARELEQAGKPAPQFVNFSAGNIEALLPSRFLQAACRFRHVVLIADAHLYPLARCYHREFRGIAGVFRSDTPRPVIMATLRHLRPGDKMALPALPKETDISYKEAFILEEALSGVPVGLLARHYRRNPKTLYGWRQEIARKLAVRQLNHLLMLPAGRPGDAAYGGGR